MADDGGELFVIRVWIGCVATARAPSALSEDGKFHILIIDKVDGAFLLPSGWKHIIRFQDHKPEYIPGTENREYWD